MGKKPQVLIVLSPFGKLRHAMLGGSERTLCGRKAELWPIDVKGGEPSCAACRIGLTMHEKRQGMSRKKRRERLQRKQTGARARLTVIDDVQGYTVAGASAVDARIEELAREARDPSIVSQPELRQCKACPWKVSTVPGRDIPNGYCRAKHVALQNTIAKPGDVSGIFGGSLHMMACHESPVGAEKPCVGWLANQLGPGNNIALRLLARDGRFKDMKLDGEQHETLQDTLGDDDDIDWGEDE